MGKLTVNYNEQTATFMRRMIRRMVIGDALVSKPWRLERIDPLVGFEYYILYCGSEVVGIQYVRAAGWLNPVQEALAAYLVVIGFRPSTTFFGEAKTRDTIEHNRLPILFPLALDRRKVVVVKVGRGFNLVQPPARLVAKMRYKEQASAGRQTAPSRQMSQMAAL